MNCSRKFERGSRRRSTSLRTTRERNGHQNFNLASTDPRAKKSDCAHTTTRMASANAYSRNEIGHLTALIASGPFATSFMSHKLMVSSGSDFLGGTARHLLERCRPVQSVLCRLNPVQLTIELLPE